MPIHQLIDAGCGRNSATINFVECSCGWIGGQCEYHPFGEEYKMKIMIVGHARHGKDTVAHMLCAIHGLDFVTSSQFCAEEVVRPYMAKHGIYYANVADCYKDRGNHREHWFNAITDFNTPLLTRLTQAIFARYDMYCGIRNFRELEAVRLAIDVKRIWVDASERIEPEPTTSITVTREQCDWVVYNNGDLDKLWSEVKNASVQYLKK